MKIKYITIKIDPVEGENMQPKFLTLNGDTNAWMIDVALFPRDMALMIAVSKAKKEHDVGDGKK